MARRLNRLVSIVLSAALVLLSAGFDAQQAAAQTITGRAVPATAIPSLGAGIGNAPMPSMAMPVLSLAAPALSAPAALTSAPRLAAPVALTPVAPAAAIAAKVLAAAPALLTLAKPETGGSAASVAGRDLENILTGVQSAKISGEIADAVAAVPSALASDSPKANRLSAPSAAPEAPQAPVVPAAAPKADAPKTVESASSYSFHRLALKTIAAVTGAVFSLPQAGAALTAKIIASAADKQLVISDFDDTLAGYNEVLPAQKVAAIRAIRAAGKHFAVVSDRGDEKRPGSTQLTVFESLASLPADVTEGMYVAANSGGKLYRFQGGVPVKIHEATPLEAAKLDGVKAAAAATLARLSEIGVEPHPGDAVNPKESYNTYGYAMMIKAGTDQAKTKKAADILREELAKQGLDFEVSGRVPKDIKNPSYVTFSIITKAESTALIAKHLDLTAAETLVIGDMMYVPRAAKKASWLTRAGLKLSGLEIGETGNETDRNMSKGLPGVLALGVGRKMDPRIPNGWNLAGHGPEVTQKVLESVASKARRVSGGDKTDRVETGMQLGMIALIVGLGALGWYAMFHAFADIVRLGEEALRNWQSSHFGQDAAFYLGATTLGMVGMFGHADRVLPNPNQTYAKALKQARDIALERGVSADQVRFVEATASMPVHDGQQWKYTFSVPGALIYVDFSTFLGGAADFRARVYEGALPSQAAYPVSIEGFASVVALDPEHALLLLRNELPGFGAGSSVSLALRPAADGNGAQMSYKFYDDHGSIGTVGAAGAFVRVDSVSDKAAKAAAKAAVSAPAGLKHAVEPNELYALALENITAKAAAAGVSADKIKFLSAVHQTRTFNGAWIGDEWRFFFGWGGENGGISYMVPARRTMITETMMDAFEPESNGVITAEHLASGVSASYFNMGVKTTPDAALAAADGVTRVSLLPRSEPVSGDKDLWYSLQNSRDELAAVNARTGEVRKAEPKAPAASPLKAFLAWLGLASLVAVIYGGLYWAGTHAPAAVPQGLPDGYNGPIPTIDEVFRGMGGILGLGVLAGTLRGAKKPKVTDADIAASAKSVVSSKGGIWSQTEYNMGYYNTLESLKARGATKAQIALYEKLCAEAPVIGGRFNPWSGD